MRRFFLITQGRALSYAFSSFGLASMAFSAVKGGFWSFLLSPPGLPVAGLALVMLGLSIEETGTVRRIRLGAGLRVFAFVLLLVAGVWAIAEGALGSELVVLGTLLFGFGVAGATTGFVHDKGIVADVRHGQAIRLETISAQFVSLWVRGRDVKVPTSILRGVALARDLDGRGVFVLVRSRDGVVGGDELPWIATTREGETFFLTEHEAGLDAEVLATRLTEAAAAAQEGGYR
ncbi:hypothetical protein [Polyangium fumosum]|uniref:Uncharacterized protein n=1 Tax=Polyangium fumosum TaxID=889272 RepID=A0A4U1JAN1_9BACT|nr:hypothetical protein [Polyangium fumosum]TKD05331.1 hypothetical protein E8A74_21275 [Polyangium fumosum]